MNIKWLNFAVFAVIAVIAILSALLGIGDAWPIVGVLMCWAYAATR